MQRTTRRQVPLSTVLGAGLGVLLLAVWLIWWQWDAICGSLCAGPTAPAGPGTERGAVEQSARAPTTKEADPQETWLLEARRDWETLAGAAPRWPDDFAAPRSCERIDEALRGLCATLDSRPYASELELEGGACGLVESSTRALAGRPPVPSAELRDLSTVLGNVFHLSRALGGKRVRAAARLSKEEQAAAEPIAFVLFRWASSREACAAPGEPRIDSRRLYDYAGFLFQTMGGQAYLRRRAPRIEALAGFYALQALERAEEQGHNPHGIDPRPEIARTRSLIERERFVFREQYLRILDEMSRRWAARAG